MDLMTLGLCSALFELMENDHVGLGVFLLYSLDIRLKSIFFPIKKNSIGIH